MRNLPDSPPPAEAEARLTVNRARNTPDRWHYVSAAGEPAFANGWANIGAAYHSLAFRKINDRVYFKGSIAGGTMGLACFVLPAGYRPIKAVGFSLGSGAVPAHCIVDAAGNVYINGVAGVSGGASLDNCFFFIE